jgi:dTDP-4-amino-4,6-dideoxygalactose transaminase
LVDCDPTTFHLDLADAERKLADLKAGRTPLDPDLAPVGIMPVHVGGLMMNMDEMQEFARRHKLWIIEDAAHSFPAAYRAKHSPLLSGKGQGVRAESCRTESPHPHPLPEGEGTAKWRRCGENTAAVTCYSFYPNKTITTGEGGMAVTDDPARMDRMRQMALHGLSHDAWKRFAGNYSWDYRIVAPGYKYNFTDIAAAIGIHQLRRAESLRQERESIAREFLHALADVPEIELPPDPPDRIHAWHLFPVRLKLERLRIDRGRFMELLREGGVGCSVHWRPLHQHPYYEETFGWRPEHLPVASAAWMRAISLPIFPGMRPEERRHVADTVRRLCRENCMKV